MKTNFYFIDLDRSINSKTLSLGGNDVRTSKNITLGEGINAACTYLGGLSFNFDLSSEQSLYSARTNTIPTLKRYLQGFNRDNKSEVIKDHEWYRYLFRSRKNPMNIKLLTWIS